LVRRHAPLVLHRLYCTAHSLASAPLRLHILSAVQHVVWHPWAQAEALDVTYAGGEQPLLKRQDRPPCGRLAAEHFAKPIEAAVLGLSVKPPAARSPTSAAPPQARADAKVHKSARQARDRSAVRQPALYQAPDPEVAEDEPKGAKEDGA
jgi:hypothetical protein